MTKVLAGEDAMKETRCPVQGVELASCLWKAVWPCSINSIRGAEKLHLVINTSYSVPVWVKTGPMLSYSQHLNILKSRPRFISIIHGDK